MDRKQKFGIEVEFYIVDKNGQPILESNELIKSECLKINPNLKIVSELSSFQIEINPGPWELNSKGLKKCKKELKKSSSNFKKSCRVIQLEIIRNFNA